MSVELGTKQKALREANSLLQKFGYNGFSFQHVADSLGIKKPSLYAHFESKEELGLDLIESYKQWLIQWSESMSELDPEQRVSAYFDMFFKFSQKGSLYCPIASLNAEAFTLPSSMKKKLKLLYESQLNWMKKIIADGQVQKTFRSDLSSEEMAEFILSLGMGSQFLGRISSEADKVKMLKRHAILFLKG
jgi:TetR/AcrR family transcriptional repressor of nem operon